MATATNSWSDSSIVTAHNPPTLDTPPPVYSHYTLAPLSDSTTLVTVAGQIAVDPETRTVASDLASQVSCCLGRVGVCLEAAGATTADVTRLMYYVVERAWEGDDTVRMLIDRVGAWLGTARPASCLLVVKSLSRPEYLCEFEAMAVVRRKKEGE